MRDDAAAILGAEAPAVLATGGVSILDGYLSDEARRALARSAEARAAAFRPAQIGSGAERQRREDVRGDEIAWLEPPFTTAEHALLARLEALRLALNEAALLGLFELELHYARYPAGARYERHLDQPRGRGTRRVTLVLYLNEAWDASDGGELRIEANGCARDVLPIGGRLVLFSSGACEHEVLPARRPRLSLTGWFRTRASSASPIYP